MKRVLPIILVLLAVLTVFPGSVSANNEIRRYYDWSATLEGEKTQVLGATTFGQLTSGASPSGTTATPPATAAQPQSLTTFNRYLMGSNLTPDNFFYFLKPWQENIAMTLTFDPKEKEKTRLAIAGERLEEMNKLTEAGKVENLDKATSSYQKTMEETAVNLEKLKEKKEDLADLLKLLEEETAKHTIVLERVIIAVPEQGKRGIERALEASWQGMDKVADLSNKPAVPQDLADRIAALKAQGLLTEEEAAKLIAVKTRGEARSELQKYMKEGILPESDFLRLNENVKSLYPDDFYELHELKRFYTLKKLESEKPDEATLSKIQEFAKNYKPGTVVPPDIRRYWGPIVQLEEIQNTLRPDLIDPELFRKDSEDAQKFAEIVERYKPRPEDVAFVNSYLTKNPDSLNSLPPEYLRMQKLAEKFGAQCGVGFKWKKMMCVPEDFEEDLPEEIERPRENCAAVITSAKNRDGFCRVFQDSCIPSGWTKVESCTETPAKSTGPGVTRVSCPTNAHFVPVYGPDSGYCIPNYTPIKDDEDEFEDGKEAPIPETICPTGYHRNYPGGPCLPDYKPASGTFNYFLPPLTSAPGNYPNPFYPPSSPAVGGGSPYPTRSECVQPPECLFTEPRCYLPEPPGGWCYTGRREERKVTPIPGGDQSCREPAGGCGERKYWDSGSCVCREENSYPTRCTYPSSGCGENRWFDWRSCSCKESSTGSGGGGGGPPAEGGGGGTDRYQPPKGYGSCPSGQYWNGSTCISPPKEEKREEKREERPPEYKPPEYKPPEQKPPESKPPEEKHEEQKPPEQKPPEENKPPEQPPQQSNPPPAGEMH